MNMRSIKRDRRFILKAFGIALRNFVRDDCLTLSSSIAFIFLLAIIPFSALFLYLLNVIRDVFLPGLFPQNMVAILVEDIGHFIPFVSRNWIQTHVIDSVGLGSFTTINLLLLPIISGLLFKTLEESFRKIFSLQPRPMLLGQAVYAFMSIFTILLFFMANFIWTIVSDATQPIVARINQTPYVTKIYAIALDYISLPHINMVSILILVLFFLITVRLFLKIKIKMAHRVLAGLLFGVLWLLAREFFGFYIQHVSRINVLYGSLSSVCIILLWTFYSSGALLYSVEFMYVMHCGPYKRWRSKLQRWAAD